MTDRDEELASQLIYDHVQALKWDQDAPEREKTLVVGNLHGFYPVLLAAIRQARREAIEHLARIPEDLSLQAGWTPGALRSYLSDLRDDALSEIGSETPEGGGND